MKGRCYVIHNGESVNQSVTKVGIELLGQLKKGQNCGIWYLVEIGYALNVGRGYVIHNSQ